MAKKNDPTEQSVEERLKNLYALQTNLTKIDEIKILRGELPDAVEDLEDEIAGLKTRIEKTQEDIKGKKTVIAERKQKMVEANDSIARYEAQQKEIRNNREYDILGKEIEYQTLEIQLQEKKIKEAKKEIADMEQAIEEYTHILEEREKDLEVKRKELEEIVKETQAEEETLRSKSKQLETQIEPRLLSAFKRIRKNTRNGLGIVYVERESCGGCFNKIPPQRQLDIRMHKKVIVCEFCGRILIDPELAGIKIEKPKETKRRSTRRKKSEADED